MLIQGIKRGRNIELLEDLDIADGEKVTVEVLPQRKSENFWKAMQKWREEYAVEELDIDPDKIWGDVRDRSPGGGREFSWNLGINSRDR